MRFATVFALLLAASLGLPKGDWRLATGDLFEVCTLAAQTQPTGWNPVTFKKPSDAELKSRLTPEQYAVTQHEGTERPFHNAFCIDQKHPPANVATCCPAVGTGRAAGPASRLGAVPKSPETRRTKPSKGTRIRPAERIGERGMSDLSGGETQS